MVVSREDLLAGTRFELGKRVLVTEKECFEGYQIMNYKGIVWGVSVRSKNPFWNFLMFLKRLIGGNFAFCAKLSDETRQEAMNKMINNAKGIGANAIINFRFDVRQGAGWGKREVVACGNAIMIEPIKNYVPIGGLGNILAEFVDNFALLNAKDGVVKPASPQGLQGKLVDIGDTTCVECPNCSMRYKLEKGENEKYNIKGFKDIDKRTEGYQIYCLQCGTKFTIPNT